MKRGSSQQGNAIRFAAIRCQQREVSDVVAAGEEDMFALIIICKQAEHFCKCQHHPAHSHHPAHTSNLMIRTLLLVSGVNVVKQVLGPSKAGSELG